MQAGFQYAGHFDEFVELGPKSSDSISIRRRGRNCLLPNALFYRKNIVPQLHEFSWVRDSCRPILKRVHLFRNNIRLAADRAGEQFRRLKNGWPNLSESVGTKYFARRLLYLVPQLRLRWK